MKQPWFKFYAGDWRQCPELRLCSLEARGLWMDILCLAHQAEPYGHLIIGGRPPTTAQIAFLVGRPPDEVARALLELVASGVCSQIDGTIVSRKMIRDSRLSAIRAEVGSKGGRARLEAFAQANLKQHNIANGQPQNQSQSQNQKEEGIPRGKPRLPISDEVKGTPLDRPDFLEAMESWESSHGRYKTTGLRAQLHRLRAWGPDRAVSAIRYSLAQGFQGIYEDKSGNGFAQNGSAGHKPSKPKRASDYTYGTPEWAKANGLNPEDFKRTT